MAAEEAWKTRFRELVVEAEGLCRPQASLKIVYARGSSRHRCSSPPLRTRTILEVAEQALENTAGDLAAATSMLGAPGSSRGGDAPDRLLPRILGLADMTNVQREASRKARDARILAVEAYHAMELCCDCLLTIRHLLHHPFLPGLDGVIEHQRAQAYGHLVRAKEKVDACAALAARARHDVSAAAD
ncbi:hypothetical protein QYE76_059216 [Lolium multiflorum]|uniref:Uncharacterized protein n=1 Tax=Lolium multiflorum TaxID=4521 RepID=A0AAD8PJX6_LOLMU|nr:hypothetical protein QYE76_059216 [Lolium multiflorum]